jgi:uncharacterized protein GlcG (DUF336 family)
VGPRAHIRRTTLITVKTIGLADANQVIQAGIARAIEIGSPSTFTVVDVGGTVIAQARMDGARLASAELAYNKAYTALATQLETAVLGSVAQPGSEFFGIANALGGRVIVFAGGMPIIVDSEVVGASGGTGEQARLDRGG